MSGETLLGKRVRLISLPTWLAHDLPASEQLEMRGCVGKIAIVQEIDSHGYLWIGFGITTGHDDGALYSGHAFGVSRECVELVTEN